MNDKRTAVVKAKGNALAKIGLAALTAWFTLGMMVSSAVNIDSVEKYAYGENVGWVNFNPTHGPGVTVTQNCAVGYVTGLAWGENIGWVKLASGTAGPFANNSDTNWGVNMDGDGNLSGYAYGENVGWIKFDTPFSAASVDINTGEFSGRVYGENIGWLSLRGTAQDASPFGVKALLTPRFVPQQPTGISAEIGLEDGQVTYRLDADPCATWYQLWINRGDTKWKSQWFNPGIQTGTVELVINDQPLGNYDYWIRGWSPEGAGVWSEKNSLVLGKPAITAPAGGVVLENRTPTFFWDSTGGATWHQVWINRNGETYLSKWVESSAEWVSDEELPCGDYQWWVRGWRTGGNGSWSESASFTIDCCAPVRLTALEAVPNPDTGGVTYNANADLCATWYQLWINRAGAQWKNQWYNPGVQAGTVALVIDNQPVGDYNYWMRGWSPDGIGPWSEKNALALGKAIPTYPLDQQTSPDRLKWNKESGHTASWFYLHINHANGNLYWKKWVPLGDTLAEGEDLYYSLPMSLPSGAYNWWIQTWQSGNVGPWSDRAEVTVP